MPFPFGKSHKSPADIVKNLKDSMTVLEKHDISDKKAEKVGWIVLKFTCSSLFTCGIHHLWKKGREEVENALWPGSFLGWEDKFEVAFWSLRYCNVCFMVYICLCMCFVYIIQATEEVSKSLVAMKEILYGTNEKEPQTEAVAQLAQELYNSGLLSTLIADLQLIDFEVRLCVFCGRETGKYFINEIERRKNKVANIEH